MDLKRIRKALVAAGTATGGAFVLGLFTEIPRTDEGWVALVLGSLAIGATAGRLTFQTRNAGTDNGSDVGMTPAEVEAFKAAFKAAVARGPQSTVLPDDDGSGPLGPNDRRR